MFSSTTSVFICVAAIWLTQRLLTINQVIQFRKQLVALGRVGQLSVGVAKAFARRVYVGLAFDPHGTVTSSLVLRGVTVFSRGRLQPALIGCTAFNLAAGKTPPGLPKMVARAAVQSAELLVATLRPADSTATSAA